MVNLMRILLLLLLLPGLALAQPAQRHMVATASPPASEAARQVLRDGGSALDAAIAAGDHDDTDGAQASGIGGGALLLHYDGEAQAIEPGMAAKPRPPAPPRTCS
jgi:gamma-glutamyltranspeptidase/glutathione hydrolase